MVPKLFVFSKIVVFAPCELENARVLYKLKRKFAFFFGENQIYFIS